METLTVSMAVVVALIFTALVFDFLNGFHDAANSIATVVSTRVLSPYQAVIFAAFFNFVALFVFQLHVATTVGSGIIDQGIVDQYVVFGALVGAITWNIITWYFGIPSSSSHALIGGIMGAGVAKGGTWVLVTAGIAKIFLFIVLSPLIGFALAAMLMVVIAWLFRRSTPSKVDRLFRRLQLVSASLYSLGHGGNDAQKTAGIIWMLLIASGHARADQPFPYWVAAICYVTIALGTLAGGWRIVKTMGQKITKLKPFGGFCAETSAGVTLFTTAMFGIPVSTTHTITGAIVGVGAAQNASAVQWGVATNIVIAWILTIPCSAFISAVAWWTSRWLFTH